MELYCPERQGLTNLSVVWGLWFDVIKQHPKKMEPPLVAGTKKPLTAEEFLSLVVYEDVDDSLKQHFIHYVHLPGKWQS